MGAILLVLLAAPVDHSAFDALLKAHVTTAGLVDYDSFERSTEFRGYLDRLARTSLEGQGEEERLAFWINAYNAWTIAQVNAHGERASIRNIRTSLSGQPIEGPWSEPMVRAAGRTLTLDELEHQVIRREFREARVHFALVCAAVSCPPLRREAYTGARLDEQLDAQGRAFLASPERNRVDAAGRIAFLSPLFGWYRDDFGGTDQALGRFLARFLPPGPEREILASGRFERRETAYDWSLNAAPQPSRR